MTILKRRSTETNTLISNIPEKRIVPEAAVTEVLEYGTGWVIVKKADGNKYKRSGGTLSWRYHNAGNVKYGKFAKLTHAVGKGWGGHAVYESIDSSKEAMRKLLFTDVRRYHKKSLLNALRKYAPKGDMGNRPDRYARYVGAKAGVSIHKKLGDMTKDEQDKVMEAMIRFEGHKEGHEELIA